MKKNIDYKAIFFMGIIFLGTGVVFLTSINVGLGIAFMVMGLSNMIIGGKNKEKWSKK